MTPGQTLINRLVALLAADATTLAPAASNNKVHLAIAAFTPAPALTPAGLTEATFTGYTALSAGLSTQQVFFDPATGNQILQILEPAGGWHWATTGSVGLPQTVYGYWLSDNGNTTVYGSAAFATPIVLGSSGQGVDIAQVRFTFPAVPMS